MYPPETVIAEKFGVIASLGMTNSRMNDYDDLLAIFLTELCARSGPYVSSASDFAISSADVFVTPARSAWSDQRLTAARTWPTMDENSL